MTGELIAVLDAAASVLPVATRHGLASLVGGSPHVYAGGQDYVPVATDTTGTWSYWRLLAPVTHAPADIGEACTGVAVTYSLRMVAWVDRDECSAALTSAVNAIRAARRAAITAIGASDVQVTRAAYAIDQVWAQEFQPPPEQTVAKMLVNIDVQVMVEGAEGCLLDCGEESSALCLLIDAATLSSIRECLGDRLDELCDIPPPDCDPLNVRINAQVFDQVLEPCGKGYDLRVLDCEDNSVGEPGEDGLGKLWRVPCAGAGCEDPLLLRFAGRTILEVMDPCGVRVDINCDTEVIAAYIEGPEAFVGVYKIDGDLNGKDAFRRLSDGAELIYTSNDNWRLFHPVLGTFDAAPGDEDHPWGADWSATVVVIRAATIGEYCCEPCPPPEPCEPLTVNINDQLIANVDEPCGDRIDIYVVCAETGDPIGEWNEAEERWEVPCDKPTLCDLLTDEDDAREVAEALEDCLPEGVFAELVEELCPTPPEPTTGLFAFGNDTLNGSLNPPVMPFEHVSEFVWTRVSIGPSHWIGIKAGELWVSGDDNLGACGQGGNQEYTPLVRIGTDSDWTDCAAGTNCSLAIRAGRLYVTGAGANGRLGNGSTANVSTFTQVGTDTDWERVSSASGWSAAIKGGELFTCGANTSFQTGLNTSAGNTLTWTLASNAEVFTDISCGVGHGLAIGAAKLFSWGSNGSGRTGQGTTAGATQLPTQVGGLTNYAQCAAGFTHSMVLRTTGVISACGLNTNGRLGDGTTTQRTNLVTSGLDSDWAEVRLPPFNGATQCEYSIARKTDGTLHGVGINSFSQIGQSGYAATNTDWLQIGSATNHAHIACGPGFTHTVRS